MKNKIVIWALDDLEAKFLLGIQLDEKENNVNIYKFPEAIVTEDFHKLLMNDWKGDKEVEFPKGFETISKPLSVTDDLLPENLKVDRPDIITRAKAEWHFAVLSSKLNELYQSELSDLQDKIERLEQYSAPIWEEMKGFWDKVQSQVREKNLFREHGNALRNSTNALFDKLKALRKDMDSKFKEESKKQAVFFNEKVEEIRAKIEGGKTLQPLFEELKKLQSAFTKERFAKDDRAKIWDRIDGAFKLLKEKKYGSKAGNQNNNNSASRLESRYAGLVQAIARMKSSIDRDLRDKNSQSSQAERAGGQLEAQLRQARIMMIDERISSKQVKMKDMLKTKEELESKIAKEKAREQRRKDQADLKAKTEAKKQEIKEKIASETSSNITPEDAAKLEAAAKSIKDAKKKPTPPVEAQTPASAEKIVATAFVADAIISEGKTEDSNQKIDEKIDTNTTDTAPLSDAVPVTLAETVVETIVEEVPETEPVADTVLETVEETVEDTVEEKESLLDKAEDAVENAVDEVTEFVEDMVDNVKAAASVAMDKISDLIDTVKGEEEE